MSTPSPSPAAIAEHYDTTLKALDGEYIHSRWGDSEIKRRHYRQTETAIRYGLAGLDRVGAALEIGCGPAVWTPLYLDDANRVDLLDISEEMLRAARERLQALDEGRHAGKVSYTRGDFLQAAPPAAAYDTVFSARAFEYMSDKPGFVRKCATLLNPGGSMLLVTKNRAWRDLVHARRKYASVAPSEVPFGVAMQLEVTSWQQTREMFVGAGLHVVSATPVIIGSYERPFAWAPGLAACDLLHRIVYRRDLAALPKSVDALTESFMIVARKTA